MIKDAIANIARNREVLHFLSCIARFLGHFSGLPTIRPSGLLPYADNTPGIVASGVQRAAQAIITPTDGSHLWRKTRSL